MNMPSPEDLREMGLGEDEISKMEDAFKRHVADMVKRVGNEDERVDPEVGKERKVFLGIMAAEYMRKHDFKPGDYVVWKQGLKNKRYPRYGDPAIVLEVFDPPLTNPEEHSGSPYFAEQLSIKIGFIDFDGEFIQFTYDGNRFEPYTNGDE